MEIGKGYAGARRALLLFRRDAVCDRLDKQVSAMTADSPITQDVLTIPRKAPEGGKVNLIGLTRDAMRTALIEAGTPEKQAKMRVGQIWQWIYQWGVRDFEQMTNLSKAFRADLAERFCLDIPQVVSRQISADGTRNLENRAALLAHMQTLYGR